VITDAILTVLLAPLSFLLGVVPAPEWPLWFRGCHYGAACTQFGEVDTLGTYAYTVGRYMAVLDPWINVRLLLDCISFTLVAFGVSLAIRTARFLLSTFTGGGGAT
jgi:hypothetical protein